MTAHSDIIDRYVTAFAALEPETMEDLLATVEADIRFVDPFNDVIGRAGFRAIFDHMFATCRSPAFHILDVAVSQGERKPARLSSLAHVWAAKKLASNRT